MKPFVPLAGRAAALLTALPLIATLHAQQPPVAASPAVDPLDRLQTALQAVERDSKKQSEADPETTNRRIVRTEGFSSNLQNIRDALARDDDATALNYLNQLRSYADSEEARNACDAVIAQIRKTRADRDAAYAAKVDDAIKRASQVVLSAKTPKDLDAILQEFGQFGVTRANRYNDPSPNGTNARVHAAVTFLNRWQDYLFEVARGDEQSASNSLRNAAENNSGYNLPPLIPRSEILARMPANRGLTGDRRALSHTEAKLDAAVEDLLDHTRVLGDITVTLGKLEALRREFGDGQLNYGYNSEFGFVQTSLQNFEKTRLELESGLGTTINVIGNRSDGNNSKPGLESRLVALRAELILMALPRLLNAPGERAAAGEGVDVFLRRLIEAAKKRADWTAVVHGLDLARSLATGNPNSTSTNSQENEAFKQFFTGLNMEAAGQYQHAAIAYLNALKTGVQDLPTALIGEHLAAIQKEHPGEYTVASTYSLNSLSSPNTSYPSGLRGSYDARPGRSGYLNTVDQGTPSPTVTIPAASPGLTPAPSPSVAPANPKTSP